MTTTKALIIRALENICDGIDEISVYQTRESTFDRLKLDCNLDGLTNYLMLEINGAKHRSPYNDYWPISKHQLVGVLRSFIEPSGIHRGDEATLLPLIERIADFLLISMRK